VLVLFNSLLQHIKAHWKISLLVLLFFPLLLRLGFWQLDRAKEKQQELTVYQQRQDLPVIPIEDLNQDAPAKYRAVSIEGLYDEKHYWLLDNQPRLGKTGYEIIMPFTSKEGVLLVNRGWVEASPRRNELPNIQTPSGNLLIKGYLSPSQENAIFKNTVSDLSVEWPKRVLQVNVDEAFEKLRQMADLNQVNRHQVLLNKKNTIEDYRSQLLLRIDSDSPGALLTEWPLVNTKPEKHQGYAVQWFSMAGALLVLYLWFLYRNSSSTAQRNYATNKPTNND